MSEAIETIEHAGQTIEIFQDDCGFSPRDNDNICIIHIGSTRYSFGDENYTTLEAIEKAEKEAIRNGDIVYPLYHYTHSGITISLDNTQYPFNDQWDAGQCGFVQVRRSEMIANWGKKNFTPKIKAKCLEVAQREVKELDSFLRGEVYLFSINDYEESCGGFIGDIKYCIDEAKGAAEHLKEYKEKEVEKARIEAPLPLFPVGMAVLN